MRFWYTTLLTLCFLTSAKAADAPDVPHAGDQMRFVAHNDSLQIGVDMNTLTPDHTALVVIMFPQEEPYGFFALVSRIAYDCDAHTYSVLTETQMNDKLEVTSDKKIEKPEVTPAQSRLEQALEDTVCQRPKPAPGQQVTEL